MTAPLKTVSDHILAAMALLDKESDVTADDATRAREELEQALELIQFVRCDGIAALNRF